MSYRIASHMLCIQEPNWSAHHISRNAIETRSSRQDWEGRSLPSGGNRHMLWHLVSQEQAVVHHSHHDSPCASSWAGLTGRPCGVWPLKTEKCLRWNGNVGLLRLGWPHRLRVQTHLADLALAVEFRTGPAPSSGQRDPVEWNARSPGAAAHCVRFQLLLVRDAEISEVRMVGGSYACGPDSWPHHAKDSELRRFGVASCPATMNQSSSWFALPFSSLHASQSRTTTTRMTVSCGTKPNLSTKNVNAMLSDISLTTRASLHRAKLVRTGLRITVTVTRSIIELSEAVVHCRALEPA